MKKSICLFLIFLLIVLIPVFSRADIGLPGIPEYNAIIVKPEGTELLDDYYNKTGMIIPFNSEIIVRYEYFGDENNYAFIDYNGKTGYVKIADIQALSEDIDFSEYENVEDKNLEMYAYKEGAYLYKGPSVTYGKVDNNEMVKVGDTVKILYDAGGECWGYVNYNGTKGWIYYYQLMDDGLYEGVSSLCRRLSTKQSVITYKDNLKLVSSPDNRENYLDIEIPKQTKLEYQNVFELHEEPYVYVTYNGVSGWLNASSENAVLKTNDVYIYINDKNIMQIYESPFDVESRVNNFETGNVYRVSHYATDHTGEKIICVVEIEGKNYWIREDFMENSNPGFFYMVETEYLPYNLVKNECKVYASIDENSEVVATLEKNKMFKGTYINCGMQNSEIYQDFTYVANLGFVKSENIESCEENPKSDDSNIVNFSKVEDELEEEIPENNIDNSKIELIENAIEEKTSYSILTITIMCIVGAIIIAVTTVVIIKLVNKKNSKKS